MIGLNRREMVFGARAAVLARVMGLVLAWLMVSGCGPQPIDDPLATLGNDQLAPSRHLAAMDMLDQAPDEPYIAQLHRMIWVPGYTVGAREAALDRLEKLDPDGLQQTIRFQLPDMVPMLWRQRLCAIIAERGWVQQTNTLINAWARRRDLAVPVTDWPEYHALRTLHGSDAGVTDELFRVFVETRSVAQQGLRTRAWELLDRLGERERLAELLRNIEPGGADLMLDDLRAAALELGVVPATREEILWIRSLRQPEHADFWQQAREALAQMPRARRLGLSMRDVPVAVAVHRYAASLLTMTDAQLYQQMLERLRGAERHSRGGGYGMEGARDRDRLSDWRAQLTWGDLAAMTMALEALAVMQVADHLFDFADRDLQDRATEYGGLIELDAHGRFNVLEFVPRIRQHDEKFIAPPEMFEASYTALFHFHFHAQRYRNADFAGPGMGDREYAESVRANCIVLTFISEDRMNIDFYRHGGVHVDLGVVHRPGKGS